MTPELRAKIDLWRSKALDGTITEAEMLEAVIALREDRLGAAIASETSRKAKAPKPAVSGNDLLDEMME